MQLAFKPIIGQVSPSPDQSEEDCLKEMKIQMIAAINNMVFSEVRSALYSLCAEAVGSSVENKIRTLLDNLTINLSDMEIKKLGETDGEEKSET